MTNAIEIKKELIKMGWTLTEKDIEKGINLSEEVFNDLLMDIAIIYSKSLWRILI